jgi:hypothetical protein
MRGWRGEPFGNRSQNRYRQSTDILSEDAMSFGSDLWVITCYFNSCGYKTKRTNYDLFMAGMKAAGANVLVIEMAFGDEEFELPAEDSIIQLRGDGQMWQKERLLNIAAKALPSSCRKIAWFDCDVLMMNSNWLRQTSEALDRFVVLQPFGRCVRLPQGVRRFDGRGGISWSFGLIYSRMPQLSAADDFLAHGHTGFAWAARRELFDHCGLYDVCLTGSGDHLMGHAFAGSSDCLCAARLVGGEGPYRSHYLNWAIQAQEVVRGRLGFVPGVLAHLWHGDWVNRRYHDLNNKLRSFDFKPTLHLRHDANGLWEWNDAPAEMREWAQEMFRMRKEDGETLARQDSAATN